MNPDDEVLVTDDETLFYAQVTTCPMTVLNRTHATEGITVLIVS